VQIDSNFFLENLELGEAVLNRQESLHIAKSFRARVGDSLELCDGKGRFASAELVEVGSDKCKVFIKGISKQIPPPQVHLAISCLSDSGEEDITFHAAQLPLAAIHLLRTERSLEPRASDLDKLCRRMEAKSLAALKQSRKAWLTEIKAPVHLDEFLENFKGNLIVCDKNGELTVSRSLIKNSPLAILTGPEGGFSAAELEMMRNKNAYFLSLGDSRLRAVSAPIFALAKVIFSYPAKTA
jgi:16S rRNA (uracil1498-N3)-methyltransferase